LTVFTGGSPMIFDETQEGTMTEPDDLAQSARVIPIR